MQQLRQLTPDVLRYINHSLKLKFIVGCVTVEIVMLGMLLGNSMRLIGQNIEQNTNMRVAEIRPLLEAALSERLFERDYASIRDVLRQLIQSDSGIKYIAVLEQNGKRYIDVGDIDADTVPEVDQDIASAVKDGVYDATALIAVGNEVVGTVHFGLSLNTLLIARDSILRQGMLIAMTAVAISIIILFTLGYWLTRHLDTLVRGTQKVKMGDYSFKVDESQADEIGELARNFNAMSEAVNERTRELLRAQEKFQNLIEGVNEGVLVVQDGVITYVNPQSVSISGYAQEELRGMPIVKLIAPEYREIVVQNYHKRISGDPNVPNNYRFQAIKQNGQCVWIEINAIVTTWEQKPATLNVIRDVSHQVALEEALYTQKERAEVTLKSIEDGVITTNAVGLTEFMNSAAEHLTGWTFEDAKGKHLKNFLQLIDQRNEQNFMLDEALWLREHSKTAPAETLILPGHGEKNKLVKVSVAPMHNSDNSFIGRVFVLHDLTQEHELREQLAHQATHDYLTGLVNRLEFEKRLTHALFDAKNENSVHNMLYLDLDQFKVVNDTCGHLAGDALLRQLASELLGKLRKTDTLSRLGGDEFAVLLRDCEIGPAVRTANALRDAVKEFHFTWGQAVFSLGVSIGVAEINSASKSAQDVMSAADVACYAAKDKGRNRVHVYEVSDTELTDRHREMHWVSEITQALKTDSFVLYQQPILKLGETARSATNFEILLRLRNPDGQLVMPGDFIPAAERFDQMSKIDRYVIQKTISCLSEHRQHLAAKSVLGIALNLSGASVSDESLGKFIRDQLEKHDIPPAILCFEITETATISNLAHARRLFVMLKRLGCRLSLDDFGRGLSSFSYLQNLPVDYLKIDRSFVSGIANNETDYAMMKAINDIGHTLGLQTIAEGVEEAQTLSCLKDMGVDYVQGYLFAKPQPFEQILTADDCEVLTLHGGKRGG